MASGCSNTFNELSGDVDLLNCGVDLRRTTISCAGSTRVADLAKFGCIRGWALRWPAVNLAATGWWWWQRRRWSGGCKSASFGAGPMFVG
ncbi:hypothetical protein Dimus_020519 [Dionaea muscipula]